MPPLNRVIGINLLNLSQSMTSSMRQARVDHIRQNMGGLPNTKDKNFYENFQALMNAFLAACGGDAGYAQLLMSELSDKVFGDQPADRIDYDLVENLKATLKDTNVDFGPDGVTATEFLHVAVIPADRVSTGAKQAGPNSLQRIATRLNVPVTRMYAGMRRQSQWQAQIDMGSKPHWLYSSQPPPSSLQAVRPAEREIIEDAVMSPLLSHPCASRRTEFRKRKRSTTPVQYLNQPMPQTVEMIRELLPARMDRCGSPL